MNGLPPEDSCEISCLIFPKKLRKMSHNLSSAAVVNGALRATWRTVISLNQVHALLKKCVHIFDIVFIVI